MKKWKLLPLSVKFSLFFLQVWVAVALLAPIIANNKAILIYDENGLHFPLLSNHEEIAYQNPSFSIYPLIPYTADQIDLKNAQAKSPLEKQELASDYYRHWLGSDALGRDVLAKLIYGSQTAFLVGFFSMLIAVFLGIGLGFTAGLAGDHALGIERKKFILLFVLGTPYLISIILLIPWELQSMEMGKKISLILLFSGVFHFLYLLLNLIINRLSNSATKKHISIPLDLIIGRLIEIMEATPLLFLIIALATLFTPSLVSILVIIGLTSWVSLAKYARAEALKIKEMSYIESARALGFSNLRIMLRHLFPNALTPLITSTAFGVAAAILIEAALSFIGLGISTNQASWGQLLAEARSNYQAWWLVLFPGMAIFLTVFSCNTIGEHFNRNQN